ncbi:PREDICTED: nuclear localization sequence-binding protein-like isoform X2 [Cercocebus atys]|uniref:nuclear localization sequence-binding protein-like isoform X2 n=1 Tax=Cercocebus atys TaxID=9531 RepID=UPI0005F425B8|nr:PREDICTED: nuclear localization sequence-binding protein-like isoform X2 [Cercocebus atys]
MKIKRKKNQGELKKVSSQSRQKMLEDEMSEAKDNSSRDEVLVPHKNCGKNTTAPGKKVGEEKSLAPVFSEKLVSPSRREAKLKDHKSHQENDDWNSELDQDEEDQNAKTLLLKNLPDKVIPHETLLVFEDAFQIRLVSKDGMSKRIAYLEFKLQAEAERALEEKQGTEIDGLAIVLDHIGEKSQGQENTDRKNSTWRGEGSQSSVD